MLKQVLPGPSRMVSLRPLGRFGAIRVPSVERTFSVVVTSEAGFGCSGGPGGSRAISLPPPPQTGFWTSGEGGQGEGDSQTSHSLFSPGKRGSADPVALLRPSALPSSSSRLPPPTFISLPSSCLRGRRAFGASVGDSIHPVRMWRVDCFAVHHENKTGHRPPRIEKAEPRKTCTVLRCLVCLFTFRGISTLLDRNIGSRSS